MCSPIVITYLLFRHVCASRSSDDFANISQGADGGSFAGLQGKSALPPRAITTRIVYSPCHGLVAKRGNHNRLDRVHPVLRFVEDDGRRRLKDIFRHFHTLL